VTIEIREAGPDEYGAAGPVTVEAYREFAREGSADWVDYLARIEDVEGRAARTTILVAVEDGEIVGSATLELDGRTEADDDPLAPHEAHIRMLGVHPDARGRGVGRLLMSACESRARDAGRTTVSLHTTQRMQAAQRMYESLGYERGDDRVFPDGFVLLSYEKQLV
jgi:ribosomal protein S18 acetylase RimI-like enzyme